MSECATASQPSRNGHTYAVSRMLDGLHVSRPLLFNAFLIQVIEACNYVLPPAPSTSHLSSTTNLIDCALSPLCSSSLLRGLASNLPSMLYYSINAIQLLDQSQHGTPTTLCTVLPHCRTLGAVVRQARDAFRSACTCLNSFSFIFVLRRAKPCAVYQLQTHSKPNTPVCHTQPHQEPAGHIRVGKCTYMTLSLCIQLHRVCRAVVQAPGSCCWVIYSHIKTTQQCCCAPAILHLPLQQAIPARHSSSSSTL
jgi:hypothetical protein